MIRLQPIPETIEKARQIARRRCEAKPVGIRFNDSGYHSKTDRSYPHFLGVLCELAFAKLAGIPVNERYMAGGDDTDFGKFEIKGSTWRGDDIELKVKISEWSRKSPEYYILARVREDTSQVEMLAFISRKDFEKKGEGQELRSSRQYDRRLEGYGSLDDFQSSITSISGCGEVETRASYSGSTRLCQGRSPGSSPGARTIRPVVQQ